MGSDNGIPTTPVNGSSSSGIGMHHHHGGNDLLNELKPNSFVMSGNKMLFDDVVHNPSGSSGLMAASRSMSSLMASQFGGGAKDSHAASSLLHLPSTAFASYHPSGSHGYDGGSVATLANLHVAHQHVVQPSSLYHGHRDQAYSHAWFTMHLEYPNDIGKFKNNDNKNPSQILLCFILIFLCAVKWFSFSFFVSPEFT